MDISKSIRIGMARDRKRQTWLCETFGVTKSYASAMYNGKVGFSTDRVQQLADAFGVKVSEFISWGEV